MKIRGVFVIASCVGATLVASCSDSKISGGTTSTVSGTTTSVAPTTTTTPPPPPASSTTVASSTTTTTTTIPAVVGLDLSADGIGGESFGAEPEGVIAYVRSILGPPTHDTGWYDPIAIGVPCPGNEVRSVTWRDLSLFFSDDTPIASGLRHFAAFGYGPPAGPVADPFGLTIDGGITLGDTVDELLAIYPSVLLNADDALGPYFYIVEGLDGYLTGIAGSDTIVSFGGGFGCGG